MSAEPAEFKLIDRKIGLLGGSVLLIGSVIGISVFFLPGELIGEAGPGILIALLITAIPMLFSVLSLLQLGGAMPVAGGIYVYGSRLVSPVWGFITIWLVLPAIWTTLLFTSLGFATFTRVFVDLPAGLLAAGVLLVFMGLSLFGANLVAWVQLVMVGAILLSILSFVIPGAGVAEVANYTPWFPAGIGAAMVAVVALYIPFQGFSMIIELGEELKDPIRNIPRVLLIGMGVAVLVSAALVAVFVGLDGWEVLGAYEEGGIAEAAADYLPAGVGALVALGAILGAFTTLNAIITSYSRTLMRASRDGVLSPKLAEVSDRRQVPHWSIVTLSLPPVLLVPLLAGMERAVVLLTVFLALVILFGNFVGSIALWNLPKRFPAAYEHSIYRLPMWLLRTAAIGSATFAVLFWLAIVAEVPAIVVGLVTLILAGAGYYRLRVRTLGRAGIDLRARLMALHAHEAIAAGSGEAPATAPTLDAPVQVGVPAGGDADRRPPRIRVTNPPPNAPIPGTPTEVRSGDVVLRIYPEDRLSEVPGLGPARRDALLQHFGSVDAVAQASHGELLEVDGVGEKLATSIQEALASATPGRR